jgi:peptidoglycan/LPS O-acetylase OafA/YrhL
MFYNIQVLRGIAAALVVWIHTQDIIPLDFIPLRIREIGFGGVDLFFVISGFIMVHATTNRDITPKSFLLKRFLRVAPLYYVMTLFVALLCIFLPMLFKNTTIDLVSLVKSLLFIPFEKVHDQIYPIYALGWTLNYEMFFYCLFTLAMFLDTQKRVAALVIMLLALAGIGLFVSGPSDYGMLVYFYTRPIILDFALGMMIAAFLLLPSKISPSLVQMFYVTLMVGCIAFVFAGYVIVFSSSSPITPITETLLRFGVPSAFIVASFVGLDRLGHTINSDIMRKIGDASYSIYLVHYIVLAPLSHGLVRVIGETTALHVVAAAVTIAISIFCGILAYRFVERPLAGDLRHYSLLVKKLNLARKLESGEKA